MKRLRRFALGTYVLFRESHSGRRYYRGGFDKAGFPRETLQKDQAKTFCSAAHAYKYGGERDALHEWRVKRV